MEVKIFEHVKQVDTPESSSLEGYGYDKLKHILYIKYRTGNKVYAFQEVSEERFIKFQVSGSKGKEAALMREEFAVKNIEGK
jgi:hypothetical protein